MVAELAARVVEDGRPAVVLYFSDFDPAGHQMPVSVARKLQALHDLLYPELDVEVQPVALTLAQVEELGLPSTPLKETERRADRWRIVMRHEQTEIDALAALQPDRLREIARAAIDPFYDSTLQRRTDQAQAAWHIEAQRRLAVHPEYNNLATAVGQALAHLQTATSEFQRTSGEAREILRAVEPPEIILPKPRRRRPSQMRKPLFTTLDDYAYASRRLIDHKQLRNRGDL